MAIDIRTTPSSASATGPGAPSLPDVQVAQRTPPSVQQALAALGGGFGFGSPYKFSGYTAPGVGNAPRKPQGMYPNYTLGGQYMYDFGTGPSWSGGGPSFGSGGGGGGGARDYNWLPDRQHAMDFAPNVQFGGVVGGNSGAALASQQANAMTDSYNDFLRRSQEAHMPVVMGANAK